MKSLPEKTIAFPLIMIYGLMISCGSGEHVATPSCPIQEIYAGQSYVYKFEKINEPTKSFRFDVIDEHDNGWTIDVHVDGNIIQQEYPKCGGSMVEIKSLPPEILFQFFHSEWLDFKSVVKKDDLALSGRDRPGIDYQIYPVQSCEEVRYPIQETTVNALKCRHFETLNNGTLVPYDFYWAITSYENSNGNRNETGLKPFRGILKKEYFIGTERLASLEVISINRTQ